MKVENAIILAAGYSSRFVPICFDVPKGLLIVKGESLIERQIRQLRERDIDKIIIITGAYAERFSFLEKKYNVKLIFNQDYKMKNNFASLYAARDFLSNSIISSSDLFFPENIFQNEFFFPYFASVYISGNTNQRCLTLDNNDKIIATKYHGKDSWVTFGGHAVLSADISKKLLKYISEVYDNPEYFDKYWVDFFDEHIMELPMYAKRLLKENIIEFNTLSSLRLFDNSFSAMEQSATMRYLMNQCGADNEQDLSDFEPIKNGANVIGCYFKYNSRCYKFIEKKVKEI